MRWPAFFRVECAATKQTPARWSFASPERPHRLGNGSGSRRRPCAKRVASVVVRPHSLSGARHRDRRNGRSRPRSAKCESASASAGEGGRANMAAPPPPVRDDRVGRGPGQIREGPQRKAPSSGSSAFRVRVNTKSSRRARLHHAARGCGRAGPRLARFSARRTLLGGTAADERRPAPARPLTTSFDERLLQPQWPWRSMAARNQPRVARLDNARSSVAAALRPSTW